MRLARLLAGGFAALLLLAVIAAAAVPPLLDWNRYRDTVGAVASAGLGRPVRITGPIRLSLLPAARLVASGVVLDDPGDGTHAAVAQMQLQISLAALLAGRIEVRDLVLRGADIRLPWPPPAGLVAGPPPEWLTGLQAHIQDGDLHVGAMDVAGIDGTLAVDQSSGTLSANGLATYMDRSWHIAGQLGRPGADGSATLGIAVDGQGPVRDTGGTLSGQVAVDGNITGRVAARGPDLSLLLAAPALPWQAQGRLIAGGGLALADDLDVSIGGVPARGAIAMRLLPAARLDAALAISRLDLDAWLPPLLHGHATALPTGVDLSAEAATLAGGTLRRLRAGFELSGDGVALRQAEAVLPGDATLQLAGRVAAGQFTGTGSLEAPDLPTTLAWLRRPAAALVGAVPPAAFRTASLSANVTADAAALALGGLHGTLDAGAVTGDVALHIGERPAIAATATLTDFKLDAWVPRRLGAPAAALSRIAAGFADFDADLALTLPHPTLAGTVLDRAALQLRAVAGTVDIARAALAGDDGEAAAAGSVAPGGRLADAKLDLTTQHAAVLAPWLPQAAGLLHGAAALHVSASGAPDALSLTATADLADARLTASGHANLVAPHWTGSVSLRHPGAPRLLAALGWSDTAPWLGDGSLSLQGEVDAAPDRVAVAGLELSAGALRSDADLVLTGLSTGPVMLTGQIAADTLTLPLPYAHSPVPLGLGALHGWQARLDVKAGRVLLGLSPVLEAATATASLTGTALRLDGLTANAAGGRLTGHAVLTLTAPPTLAVTAALDGAAVQGAVLEQPFDILAGKVGATLALSGSGYSPAAMLATLSGTAQLTVQNGVMAGFDAPRALAAGLDPAALPAIQAALENGTTAFTGFDAAAQFDHGVATLTRGVLNLAGGVAAMTGSVDLPGDAIDLRLDVQHTGSPAPPFGLRVIGPVANPGRTPEVADLARWLAIQ